MQIIVAVDVLNCILSVEYTYDGVKHSHFYDYNIFDFSDCENYRGVLDVINNVTGVFDNLNLDEVT